MNVVATILLSSAAVLLFVQQILVGRLPRSAEPARSRSRTGESVGLIGSMCLSLAFVAFQAARGIDYAFAAIAGGLFTFAAVRTRRLCGRTTDSTA